jgi:hypothetical protein
VIDRILWIVGPGEPRDGRTPGSIYANLDRAIVKGEDYCAGRTAPNQGNEDQQRQPGELNPETAPGLVFHRRIMGDLIPLGYHVRRFVAVHKFIQMATNLDPLGCQTSLPPPLIRAKYVPAI